MQKSPEDIWGKNIRQRFCFFVYVMAVADGSVSSFDDSQNYRPLSDRGQCVLDCNCSGRHSYVSGQPSGTGKAGKNGRGMFSCFPLYSGRNVVPWNFTDEKLLFG